MVFSVIKKYWWIKKSDKRLIRNKWEEKNKFWFTIQTTISLVPIYRKIIEIYTMLFWDRSKTLSIMINDNNDSASSFKNHGLNLDDFD